jgi:ribosomal protein S12 methylthiotransferase
MTVKIGFVSLGCPKNLVDSEVMMGHLTREGFAITADRTEAEILVVNTCGFIQPAKEESIQNILEMAEMKKHGRCRKLIVAGCLAERYRSQIKAEIPEVDEVLGVQELDAIVALCGKSLEELKPESTAIPPPALNRKLSTPGHFAYLKIAEGCGHDCSFCVIPQIRGPHRSRSLRAIVQEAEELAAAGVRELNLVSQDTTAYGVDRNQEHGLARLLEQLARIPEIRWIRFLYAYPSTLDQEVLELMAVEPKICRYLDLPLQHVSTRILHRMRRGGTRRSLERQIHRIRKIVPEVALRTAMIVGYPGESREEFLELMSFCAEVRFDHLGVFSYSDEEGTASFCQMPKIPERTRESRRRRLMEQQARISLQKNRTFLGKEVEVLLDGAHPDSEWVYQGRMARQAPEIDGVVLINETDIDPLTPGCFYRVRITEALEHDLVGGIVSEATQNRLDKKSKRA